MTPQDAIEDLIARLNARIITITSLPVFAEEYNRGLLDGLRMAVQMTLDKLEDAQKEVKS